MIQQVWPLKVTFYDNMLAKIVQKRNLEFGLFACNISSSMRQSTFYRAGILLGYAPQSQPHWLSLRHTHKLEMFVVKPLSILNFDDMSVLVQTNDNIVAFINKKNAIFSGIIVSFKTCSPIAQHHPGLQECVYKAGRTFYT